MPTREDAIAYLKSTKGRSDPPPAAKGNMEGFFQEKLEEDGFFSDVKRQLTKRGVGLIDTLMDGTSSDHESNEARMQAALQQDVAGLFNATPEQLAQARDQVTRDIRQKDDARGLAALPGQIVGDPLSFMRAGGAVTGGATGLLEPTLEGEDRAANAIIGTVEGKVLGDAFDLVGDGMKTGINWLLPKSDKAVMKEALDAGLPVTADQAYGGEVLPRVGAEIRQAPIGGSALRTKGEQLAETTEGILKDAADSLSPSRPHTADGAGRVLRKAGKDAASDVQAKIGAPYDELLKNLPDDVGIPTPKAKQALDEALTRYQYNPKALDILNDPLLTNVTGGTIPGKVLKQQLRKQVDAIGGSTAARDLGLSDEIGRISAALNEDVMDSAVGLTAKGDKLYRAADRQYAAGKGVIDDILGLVDSPNASDEQLIQRYLKLGNQATATSTRGADASLYRTLRRRLPKEALDKLEGYRLSELGRSAAGEFDATAAVRQFRQLTPRAQKMSLANLTPDKRQAWQAVTNYVGSVKGSLNPSGSGAAVNDKAGMGDLAKAPLYWMAGHVLANERVARAVNALPRKVLEGPLTKQTRRVLVHKLVEAGMPVEEAEQLSTEPTAAAPVVPEPAAPSFEQERQRAIEFLKQQQGAAVSGGQPSEPLRLTVPRGQEQSSLQQGNSTLIGDAANDALPADIRADEGLRHASYLDTTGHRTVGFGFNMDSGIARNVWKKAGVKASFNDVYAGRAGISDADAQNLGAASYRIAMDDARAVYPDLHRLSQGRQQALLNLSYQLGRPGLMKFRNFNAAMKAEKWGEAARHLMLSEYGQQTRSRAQEVARQILRG